MKKTLCFICLLVMIVSILTACGGAEFNVNFITENEIYSTVNTGGNETIKLPLNPTKEGYTFEGWYWDNGKWEQPFTVSSLLNTPLAADMNVYAKFKHDACTYEKETVISPTCTEKGYTLLECECGESKKVNYVLTIEHSYSEWEVRKQATISDTGVKERICTVCGYTSQEIIPKVSVVISGGNLVTDNQVLIQDFDFSFDWSYYEDNSIKLVPADVEINVEEKTYTVKVDELPQNYNDNIDTIIAGILSENNITVTDFENYDVLIYVKNESGEYEPVPLN